MKVVFCHTDYRLYWPARLSAAREFLGERGVEVHIVEISGRGSPYAFAVRADQGSLRDCWDCLFPEEAMEHIPPRRAAASVWGALEHHQPDIVFAGAIAFPSGAVSVRWAAARGRKVVICDNARALNVPRTRAVNAVKRRIYSQVDAMFLPAPSHAPDYAGWGIPQSAMFFGLNVIDNDFFQSRAEQARSAEAEIRNQLSLPRRYLLAVGRQIKKKNLTRLIDAWDRFKSFRPGSDLKLLLVGDGPERAVLRRVAEASPSREDIMFRDFLRPEVLAQYYGLASALILPSLSETWGLVVNEAMAAGLPVLVSRECGCAETLLREEENGWSFGASSTQAITRTLLRLDGCSEDQLRAMGRHSQEVIARWGLRKFCEGAWEAVQFAASAPRRNATFVNRWLLRFWNGRYRPT